MEISATKGLGGLKEKVKCEIEKCITERKKLGLTYPNDFSVLINYCTNSNAKALAYMNNGRPQIDLNVLPTILDSLNTPLKAEFEEIRSFFENVQKDFFVPLEPIAMKIINKPLKQISLMESAYSKKEFDGLKAYFKTRGKDYQKSKYEIINKSKYIRNLLRLFNPLIRSEFGKLNQTVVGLRHEIDHLDMFSSLISKKYYDSVWAIKNLDSRKIEKTCTKQYKSLAEKMLKSKSEEYTILESKALFFSAVPLNKWHKYDYDAVKKGVYCIFEWDYTNGVVPLNISDILINKYLVSGEIDDTSAAYARALIETTSTKGVENLRIDPKNTVFETANKIIYEDLPNLKKKMSDNAKIAVDAIGNTFRDDPTRFNEANKKARNFYEYIEMLKK